MKETNANNPDRHIETRPAGRYKEIFCGSCGVKITSVDIFSDPSYNHWLEETVRKSHLCRPPQ